MQFGFTLKPEHSLERTLALTRQAEAAGFEYGWLFDSHVLWRDPYPLLTLMAGVTERMRLGTCVTNPGTREPTVTASVLATLDEISGGRMDLGIGRGDSARRVLGKPPITMANTEEAIRVIRALVAGETIEYEGTELSFPWTTGWTLPVWVAGYGPMALAMTGRVADGLILQLGDPDLIRWLVGQVREAAAAAGRDPAAIRVQAAAPAHVGDIALGRERTRWFPALVSNHVVDLVNKYPREQLPEALTGYISDRSGLRLPPPRGGRLGQRVVRRGRRHGPVLHPRRGRRPRREAARAGGGRRRPVQPVPDERRRGSAAGGLRPRRHPAPSAPDRSICRVRLARRSGWRRAAPCPTMTEHPATGSRMEMSDGRIDVEAVEMIGRRHRDPWWGDEGKGAKRTRRRTQVESMIALALAIGACGLAAAVWLRQLAPLANQLGLS